MHKNEETIPTEVENSVEDETLVVKQEEAKIITFVKKIQKHVITSLGLYQNQEKNGIQKKLKR